MQLRQRLPRTGGAAPRAPAAPRRPAPHSGGRPAAPAAAPRAQQQGSSPAEEFTRQASDFARRTSRSVSEFVKEKQLDKKASAAYEDASQSLRTSYLKLEAEYDFGRKLTSIQGRLSEKAQVRGRGGAV